MRPRPHLSRLRPTISLDTITNITSANLNAIAPGSSHLSMMSLATGFSSSPPRRRMCQVKITSTDDSSSSHTYAFW